MQTGLSLFFKKCSVYRKSEKSSSLNFLCLDGNDVITSKVSDHHPIIHNGVLFWNIMMQANIRKNRNDGVCPSYNNAFGIVETERDYILRLIKIGAVVAEIIHQNPLIDAIGFCEGPVQTLHKTILFKALRQFSCMKRFLKTRMFYQPHVEKAPDWGLLMLADSVYTVKKARGDFIETFGLFEKLANRLQVWELKKGKSTKFFALAHFPFGSDEYVTEKIKLSPLGITYCCLLQRLLTTYADANLTLCADFNFNPYLIEQWQDRIGDHIPSHNSTLLISEDKEKMVTTKVVTVDGVLLSRSEKQKYGSAQAIPNMFSKLKKEYNFFWSQIQEYLERNRYVSLTAQNDYDKQFGLIPFCRI